MKPWDIWTWQAPGSPVAHPAVIVSGARRAANKPILDVVMCTSQRQTRPPAADEVLLDQADGLDWPTLCRAGLIYHVDRTQLTNFRGSVSDSRRLAIMRAFIRDNAWRI